MKYIFQMGLLATICFVAELLYFILPLPVPASIYGLVILFGLLCTKVIRLEQIEGIANFFLTIMPVLFISPSVSLMTALSQIRGAEIALFTVALASTVGTTLVTGVVAQLVINRKKGKEVKKHE